MEEDYVIQKRASQREYAKVLEAQMEEHRLKYRPSRSPANVAPSPSPTKQRHDKLTLKLPQLTTHGSPSTTPTKAASALLSAPSPRSPRGDDSTPESPEAGDLRSVVRQLQADLAHHTQLTADMNEKFNAVMQRLQSPSCPVASPLQIPSSGASPLLHNTLTHHAARLDALEKAAVAASSNPLLRTDFDTTTAKLVENKAQVVAQVASLGDRVRAVEATLSSQCPTWGHLHDMNAKSTDALTKLRADLELTIALKIRDVLDRRDQLQQESQASQTVLAQLTSHTDTRRQDAAGARMASLEAQLGEEHRARLDLEVAVQNKLEQVVVATEAAMVKVDAWQRVEQARWAQWTTQHLAACDAHLAQSKREWTTRQCELTRKMQELESTTASRCTQVQETLTNLDKVVAAEIRKRASDIAAVHAAEATTSERLMRQWRDVAHELLRPLQSQVSALAADIVVAHDASRRYRDTEHQLRDVVHTFTLKHQDAIACVRADAECQVRALESELKALQRDAELVAMRVTALDNGRRFAGNGSTSER